MARLGEGRLPRRLMFGEMARCEGYTFGQEKDLIGRLEQHLRLSAETTGENS